jgi:hypothetical protein
MYRCGLAQYVAPAVEVAALLYKATVEEVYLAADEPSQRLLDLEPIHAGWPLSSLEADKEIDIAFSIEVFAQE